MPRTFQERLDRTLERTGSLLCVGLDPDPERLPRSLRGRPPLSALRRFLEGIVDATRPWAAAYKVQLAAYWRYGPVGFRELARIVERPGPPRIWILDLKANDIPNTMRLLAGGLYEGFGFDAITVSPWHGRESLEPLTEDPSHGFFVVARASNPGARDLQELPAPGGRAWEYVAREVARLARRFDNAGLVVGATDPTAVARARRIVGRGVPMLLPGIGAQGGDLGASVRAGVDRSGRALLVAASRSILYASDAPDWRAAAAREAERLARAINAARSPRRRPPRAGP